jgi:hypothetical protein
MRLGGVYLREENNETYECPSKTVVEILSLASLNPIDKDSEESKEG